MQGQQNYKLNILDLYLVTPQLFLLVNAIILTLYLTICAGRSMHFYYFRVAILYVQSTLFFTLVILLVMCYIEYKFPLIGSLDSSKAHFNPNSNQLAYFHRYLAFDRFTLCFQTFIIFLTLVTVSISSHYFKVHKICAFEYPVLILLASLGSLTLVVSFDLMGFYFVLEFTSFCLYTLSSSYYKSVYSAEASLKYFSHGCLASGLYVFGAGIFFIISGSTSFDIVGGSIFDAYIDLVNQRSDLSFHKFTFLIIGILLVGILPLFKLGIAPYHYWVADVYEGSPMFVTAYFSIVIKVVMTISLIKIFSDILFFLVVCTKAVSLFCGLFSVVYGTFSALTEPKIKRILAYSSISHAGYILFGITLNNSQGLVASLDYIIVYAITNIIIFIFLLSCASLISIGNKKSIVYVSDLSFLQHRYFVKISNFIGLFVPSYSIAICFSIALLSFAGLPPFAGFYVKLDIFTALWDAKYHTTVVILIITNLISAFYYLRFIKCLFFSSHTPRVHLLEVNASSYIILYICTGFLIFYPFFSTYLNFCLIEPFVRVHFNATVFECWIKT